VYPYIVAGLTVALTPPPCTYSLVAAPAEVDYIWIYTHIHIPKQKERAYNIYI